MGRIEDLTGQVDRLARVVEDIAERRLVVLERRRDKVAVLTGRRLDAVAGEVAEISAEVERLAGRIAARRVSV